jgi:aryl-alcohol dehydrogenase-like predicted oxidoreductase
MKDKLIFGNYRLPTTYLEFKEMLKFLLDNGIRTIDTAHCYNKGKAEKWIGKSKINTQFTISTKAGKTYNREGKLKVSLKEEEIFKQIELSLKRLKKHKLEILFFHNYEKNKKINEIIKLIKKIKNKKYVNKIGLSNFPLEISKELIKNKLVDLVQIKFDKNLKEEIKFYNNHNIEVWLYRPFLKGITIKQGKKPEDTIQNIFKIYPNIKIIFGASNLNQLKWLKKIK